MAIATLPGENVPIKMWAKPDEVEDQALDQLRRIAALPWIFQHVAVMPDVHLGKGATVGSVIAMRAALSPAAVGVDIGCGMAAVSTNLAAPRTCRTTCRRSGSDRGRDPGRLQRARRGVDRGRRAAGCGAGSTGLQRRRCRTGSVGRGSRWARSAAATTSSSCASTRTTGSG